MDTMQLFITRSRRSEGAGYYSGASMRVPLNRFDEEVRRVDNYPVSEWQAGNATSFPLGDDGTSDEYWISWYRNGTTVWLR